MARSSIDRDSVEYVKVPITAPDGVVITTQNVEMAVVDSNSHPTAPDWRPGEWLDTTARVLVGPGQLQLTPGTYKVWVRITDDPEIPVLNAGTITVT